MRNLALAATIAFGVQFGALATDAPPALARLLQPQAHPPVITEFTFRGGALECIASGPDGNLWVTDDYDQDSGEQSAVLRVTTHGKQTGKFYYRPIYVFPSGGDITAGPDGNLWISDDYDNQLIRMTPEGAFKLISAPSPYAVTRGLDGNVWFASLSSPNTVGYVTPGGRVTTYSNGISGGPLDITAGPDGAFWFTEYKGKIGRITTGGVVTEYSMGISQGAHPTSIVTGPDGNLWFTEQNTGSIGRITPAGVATEFHSGITGDPYDIAAGRGEDLWFTEFAAGQIGRITIKGRVSEYSQGMKPHSQPTCIIKGPDDNMWFIENRTNNVVRIAL